MRRLIAALAAALLSCQAAGAAPATPPQPEQLVMKPYPGPPAWKRITDKNGPQGFYHEQIPANQTVAKFTDILTDQDFPNLAGYDPAAYLKTVFGGIPNACSGARVAGPQTVTEGGYHIAYGQVRCGRQNGQPFGVHIFYKVISGAAALYVVSREFHVPASDNGDLLTFPKGHEAQATALLNAEAGADKYLTGDVFVCGGPSTDARCASR
jgi:hypothetical protein